MDMEKEDREDTRRTTTEEQPEVAVAATKEGLQEERGNPIITKKDVQCWKCCASFTCTRAVLVADSFIIVANMVSFFVVSQHGGLYMKHSFRDIPAGVYNYKGIEMMFCVLSVLAGFGGMIGSLGRHIVPLAFTAVWLFLHWGLSTLNQKLFCEKVNKRSDSSDDHDCEIDILATCIGFCITLVLICPHVWLIREIIKEPRIAEHTAVDNARSHSAVNTAEQRQKVCHNLR